MEKQNFGFIAGFGISEKELNQKNTKVDKTIQSFYDMGVREFFVGYNPPYRYDNYWFEYSPNGRFWENEQITNFQTLKNSVEYIHTLTREDWKPCEVFLAVNAWYYTDETMNLVKKIIAESQELKVDGLIIWNVETLEYLASIAYSGKVHISTILALYNQDDIAFFVDFCAENNLQLGRIILSRELTLKEIHHLTSCFPDIDFEVFWQGDYCRYANGNCLAEHKYWNNRDLCEVVLKQGMEICKAPRYDFKEIITDTERTDQEKQNLLNTDIKYTDQGEINSDALFLSQSITGANTENSLLDEYLYKLMMNELSSSEIIKILQKLNNDLLWNPAKYLYDGLKDEKDRHNLFIKKVILLYTTSIQKLKQPDIEGLTFAHKLEKEMNFVMKIYEQASDYFLKIRKEQWWSSLETYYRFMMYNRTSLPAYHYFNEIKNITVLKIPLRWRHLSLFRMGLHIVDEAIQFPDKFITIENFSGKYFHYDFTELSSYKKFKETLNK